MSPFRQNHVQMVKHSNMLFGDSGERKKLEQQRRAEGRLPPGQSLTLKWPVLHEGSIPRTDLQHLGFPHRRACRKAGAALLE